jgi:sulfite reductase (NADPH) flavoprotein alpha-component
LRSTSDEDRKHLSTEGKALRTLRALNGELGTDYKPFEYHGHAEPEVVLVCFGSVESSLAAQAASALAAAGSPAGVTNVRLYRPFAEEQFVKLVPETTRVVGVLGQVVDASAVQEPGIRSQLYEDVLAALAYNSIAPGVPEASHVMP